MEEEPDQLYRRPQMTGHAREEEEDEEELKKDTHRYNCGYNQREFTPFITDVYVITLKC